MRIADTVNSAHRTRFSIGSIDLSARVVATLCPPHKAVISRGEYHCPRSAFHP